MIFRWFDFGKRETERNAGRLDNEFRNEPVPDVWMVKLIPDVWIMNFKTNRFFFLFFVGSGRLDGEIDSGRLDDGNEPVPDVRMMETTSSGRLDNGNQNELVPDVWIMNFETNRFWECRTKLRPRLWFIFRSPSGRKNFEGSRVPFQHFEGLMAPWTYRSSTFQRFSPASTSASDI
ncbi:unnamed protein product [Rhizophagus irregularis]|nr:unnamed protein product [Rhizophagus irregularis]